MPSIFQRGSASAPAIPSNPALKRGLTSLGRILIIEDDSAIQRALKRLFESEGYAVDLAGDGTAGLEFFRKAPRLRWFSTCGYREGQGRRFAGKSSNLTPTSH
jgi:PleD family two-component response regulator